MKKLLFSTLFFLLFAVGLRAQTYGTWNVVPNGAGLFQGFTEMVFLDDANGYIWGSTQTSPHDLEMTSDSAKDFTQLSITTGLHAPQFGAHMVWPTAKIGYFIADTGQLPNNGVFFCRTNDGGTTWKTFPLDPNFQIQNMDFPNGAVGYATGSLSDLSGDFVAKTTDSGKTWTKIYTTTDYSFGGVGKLDFINANNGLFIALNGNNEFLVGYTTDGGTSFKYAPVPSYSSPAFVRWNGDTSWLAGADAIYRSKDSGKDWTTVVPGDSANTGMIAAAAFYRDSGFAFRSNGIAVLMTTDNGQTWANQTLAKAGNDTIFPVAASMPSSRDAYVLGNDNTQTIMQIEKIAFAPPSSGGNGVVEPSNTSVAPFAVTAGTDNIIFTMEPAPPARSIQLMDELGRTVRTITLSGNASSAQVPVSELKSGTYFARLGSSVTKFAVQ